MLARLKTPVREVWQYDGGMMPGWVLDCTVRYNDGLYLIRRSGKQIIHPGEWLIRDLDGDPEWVTDAEFQRDYELS